MNIERVIALLVGLVLLGNTGFSQVENRVGAMPGLSLVWKTKNDWKIVGEFESRHFFWQENENAQLEFEHEFALTDFTLLGSRSVGLRASAVGGFRLRLTPEGPFYRSIQQYIWLSKWHGKRLAHRIASDQTFSPFEPTEVRFRYRLGMELPLNGVRVDPREFDLKLKTEGLVEFQGEDMDLEYRLTPTLGYQTARDQKLEIGLENRVDSFIDGGVRLTNYLLFSWYIRVN